MPKTGARVPKENKQAQSGSWDDAALAYCRQRATSPAFLMELPVIAKVLGDETLRGKSVLHVGCGGGHLTVFLRMQGAAKVVGIDASKPMIDFASRYMLDFDPKDVTGIQFHQRDVNAMYSGWAKEFDVVVCDLMNNVDDPVKALNSMKRVLKPGGTILLLLQHPLRSAKSDLEEDKEYMKRTGSIVIRGWFAERRKRNVWVFPGNVTAVVDTYHRPLEYYAQLLIENGFSITGMASTAPIANIVPRSEFDRKELEEKADMPFTLVIAARLRPAT